MRTLYLLIALPLLLTAQADPRLKGFDEWLSKAVADAQVPGLAIAIVADGKVIHSKGYGYRDLKQKVPVTENTLFAIGSVTKSFTVATLGTLADEGKFDWDKPVREYLPGFRLFDPAATEQVTVRDMVTHRTGLPRHDLIWDSSDFSLESIVNRIQFLPPSEPFRTRFQYNNLMFGAAGYIAASIGGKPWAELVRERLLTPLGMSSSRMSFEEAEKSSNLAVPYDRDLKSGQIREIPPFRNMAVTPAGSIYSSAADMAKYLTMHIDQGSFGGKTVVTEPSIRDMQSLHISTGSRSPYSEIEGDRYGMGYGMGLSINYYRGNRMVGHGGSIDGMRATMAFLPARKIGVVILWNLRGSSLGDNLQNIVFDRLLGAPETDWLARTRKNEETILAQLREAESKGLAGRRPNTAPAHPLSDYAGTFQHPGYGRITVRAAAGKLSMQLNRVQRPLEHFHYDTFQVPAKPFDTYEKFKLNFVTNTEGDVTQLRANMESAVPETVFQRVPDPAMFESAFLQPFTGEYELSPKPLTITLQGKSQLLLDGEKLTPIYGTRFRVTARPSTTVEFRSGQMLLYTPNAELVLKKK